MAFSDRDVDALVRGTYAEAGGPDEYGAVASTLINRSKAHNGSIYDAFAAPNQFESFNRKTNSPWDLSPNSRTYQQIRAAVTPYVTGEAEPLPYDHFYAPGLQSDLGRKPPSWDNGSGTDIGKSRFFRLGYGAPSAPPSPPGPAAATAQPGGSSPLSAALKTGKPPMADDTFSTSQFGEYKSPDQLAADQAFYKNLIAVGQGVQPGRGKASGLAALLGGGMTGVGLGRMSMIGDALANNQRIQAETLKALPGMKDQDAAIRAMAASGVPALMQKAAEMRLQDLDPMHQLDLETKQLALKSAKAQAAEMESLRNDLKTDEYGGLPGVTPGAAGALTPAKPVAAPPTEASLGPGLWGGLPKGFAVAPPVAAPGVTMGAAGPAGAPGAPGAPGTPGPATAPAIAATHSDTAPAAPPPTNDPVLASLQPAQAAAPQVASVRDTPYGKVAFDANNQPLFNLATEYRKARRMQASGIKEYVQAGETHQKLLQSMLEKGMVLTKDGGVMSLPGHTTAKFNEEFAKTEAPKLLAKASDDYATSSDAVQKLQTIAKIAPYAATGFQGPIPPDLAQTIRNMASSMGMIDGDTAALTEAYKYLTEQGVFAATKDLKPASNLDMQAARQATLSMSTNPKTIPIMMPILMRTEERRQARLEAEIKSLQAGRPPDIKAIMDDINERLPLSGSLGKQTPAGQPPAGTPPAGTTTATATPDATKTAATGQEAAKPLTKEDLANIGLGEDAQMPDGSVIRRTANGWKIISAAPAAPATNDDRRARANLTPAERRAVRQQEGVAAQEGAAQAVKDAVTPAPAAETLATRQAFDRDAKDGLSPVEMLRKYDRVRTHLDDDQLRMLQDLAQQLTAPRARAAPFNSAVAR